MVKFETFNRSIHATSGNARVKAHKVAGYIVLDKLKGKLLKYVGWLSESKQWEAGNKDEKRKKVQIKEWT